MTSSKTYAGHLRRARDAGRCFVTEAIRPKENSHLEFRRLTADDASDLNHFHKILACEYMAVDANWRDKGAYGSKTVDKYLNQIGYDPISLRSEGADDDRKVTSRKVAKAFQKREQNGIRKHIVCYDGKRLVGFVALTDWTAFGDEYANLGTQLSGLYVLPGYQRLGVGDKLLAMAEKQALADGVDPLYLEATPNALTFYKKLGYVEARSDDTHHDKSGSTIIGTLMYKDLTKSKEAPCSDRGENGHSR